jgi:hypothetical protein
VLHGEVHGALEALDARVDHLRWQPPERLLDVQVEVGVVEVVVPQAYGSAVQIKHTSRKIEDGIARLRPDQIGAGWVGQGRSPYFLRREEMACMWRRASGLRRGFTNHCDSADIIDDMVAGGAGVLLFVLLRGGLWLLPRLLAFVGDDGGGVRDFGPSARKASFRKRAGVWWAVGRNRRKVGPAI